MLFISARKGLSDENRIGPDQVFDIKIVRGVAPDPDTLLPLDGGIDAVRNAVDGKKVLVIVHGYNNEFADIARAYDLIEDQTKKNMKTKYDLVVGYTWPGGDDRFDYFAAKTRSGSLAPRFCENLRQLHSSATRPKALDVMTHSMGARLTLEALKQLTTTKVVRNLFLTAAAVDNESIEKGEEYFTANGRARNSFVFHSNNDQVLKFGYNVAEWDRALGLNGPENPGDIIKHSKSTLVINCKRKINGHGEYKSQDEIYKFLNKQVETVTADQFSTL